MTIHKQINDIFKPNFVEEMFSSAISAQKSVSVYERDEKGSKISLLVPGIKKKEISVKYRNESLTIEIKPEDKEKWAGKGLCAAVGTFYFTPFHEVDAENIKSSLKDGILEITLPRSEADVKEVQIS